MRLCELLSEARRNPAQNEKLAGHKGAVEYLKRLGKDIQDYGISMTTIPKLGINPGSRYNTPVGVYFYPAEFYLKTKGAGSGELPFMDDAPYIQVFKLQGNLEVIGNINASHFNSYTAKLFKNVNKIAQLIGDSESNTEKKLAHAIMKSGTEAVDNSYGGRLWYILYSLSKSVTNAPKPKSAKNKNNDDDDVYAVKNDADADATDNTSPRGNVAPRSSVIWNSLLRILGIDTVIDNGVGIIHKNEPYQGVVINPRTIEHIQTIENNSVKKIDTQDNYFANVANMKVTDNYIENVVQNIRELELKYAPKYKKYAQKIINNVLSVLRNNPGIYARLDISDIEFLLQITKSADVIKELKIGLYTAKFPKIKKQLDEIIEDWEYTTSTNNWASLSPERKKRQYEMIVPSVKMLQVKNILKTLMPFKSEPVVADIVTYLSNAIAKLESNYN